MCLPRPRECGRLLFCLVAAWTTGFQLKSLSSKCIRILKHILYSLWLQHTQHRQSTERQMNARYPHLSEYYMFVCVCELHAGSFKIARAAASTLYIRTYAAFELTCACMECMKDCVFSTCSSARYSPSLYNGCVRVSMCVFLWVPSHLPKNWRQSKFSCYLFCCCDVFSQRI